jgi:ribonuclease T1
VHLSGSADRHRLRAAVAAGAAVLLVLWLAACGVAVPTVPAAPATRAASAATPDSGLPAVPAADLPDEARDTLVLIDRGGPYPYAKDGSVFGNIERLLPARPRGYHREYTVPTPSSRDRGARRLVAGAEGDVYWTDDHYETFRQVRR